MTTTGYLLGNEWQLARQRLDLLERVFDPESQAQLNALGVQADWRCLDVGAGGGSIAAWLCNRVGPARKIVATDIDTRLLAALDCPRFEIVLHDIVADGFATADFDLVHTRAALCHLAERTRALDHIVDAVRPGGWVLIEEPDYITEAIVAGGDSVAAATFRNVNEAKERFVASHGFDRFYGRRVLSELRARGFIDVTTEGRVSVTPGGGAAAQFHQLSIQQMRDRIVAGGRVSGQEVDDYCAVLMDPSLVFVWPTMLATRGRKPPR
jgi:SAM-dependent methyltransferase